MRRRLSAFMLSLLLAAMSRHAYAGDATAAPDTTTDPVAAIRALTNSAHFAEARARGLALVAERERRYGPRSPEVADAIALLTDNAASDGEGGTPEVVALAQRAVKIREATQAPDTVLANAVMGFGDVLSRARQYDDARRQYARGIALWERVEGPDGVSVGAAYNNLAVLFSARSEYDSARTCYARVIRAVEHGGPEHELDLATVLTNSANVEVTLGRHAAADSLLRRALEIRERRLGPDHLRTAMTLSGLGVAEMRLGHYDEARRLHERAVRIAESRLGPDSPTLAGYLLSLSNVVSTLGDTAAERILLRARDLRMRAQGPRSGGVASVEFELGRYYNMWGRTLDARAHLVTALTFFDSLGTPNLTYARTLFQLAHVQHAAGDDSAAIATTRRALAMQRTLFGGGDMESAWSLHQLGLYERGLGWRTRARASLEASLEAFIAAQGPDGPDVGHPLWSLAQLDLDEGRWREGLDTAIRLEDSERAHFRLLVPSVPERTAMTYADRREGGVDHALSAVAMGLAAGEAGPQDIAHAWDSLLRSRSLVLDVLASRHRVIQASGDTAFTLLDTRLRDSREQLANLIVRGAADGPAGAHRALVDSARARCERAELALAEHSLTYRTQLAREHAGFDEVAAAVPAGAALVGYARYVRFTRCDSTSVVGCETALWYSACVREPGGALHLVELGAATTIDSLVDAWRREASRPDDNMTPQLFERRYRRAGAALRERVWDPVAARIGAATRVLIVPDDALELVDFATLPTADSTYLVESGPTLHVLTSERDLVEPAAARAPGMLLALGDPDFADARGTLAAADAYRGPAASCADFAHARWVPLAGSRVEVTRIAALWRQVRRARGSATVLTGADADEGAFKRLAPGAAVVHLATHGFFYGSVCDADAASPGGAGAVATDVAVRENPLLLSGLVLAGANRHEVGAATGRDDGVLTAEEIASLDLAGVRWAVLSGCGTGLGEMRAGEGVLGLRRAFRLAGARTIVTSLWSVSDAETGAWMRDLYAARWSRGLDTAEASRAATRAALDRCREAHRSTHPFSWGAFVAAGDWR